MALVEHAEGQHLGRITAFNGQMGMYVRALTYMLSHGGDGLAQAAKDAVLNANYIKARLEHAFSVPFPGQPCMHEALFDDSFLEGTGVSTLDFAKALIDEGFHPMTMYFPLVVHGAMLVEPTESREQADAGPLLRRDAGTGRRRPRPATRPVYQRADARAAPASGRDAGGPLAGAEVGATGGAAAGSGVGAGLGGFGAST